MIENWTKMEARGVNNRVEARRKTATKSGYGGPSQAMASSFGSKMEAKIDQNRRKIDEKSKSFFIAFGIDFSSISGSNLGAKINKKSLKIDIKTPSHLHFVFSLIVEPIFFEKRPP